jgi:hypothetical protein
LQIRRGVKRKLEWSEAKSGKKKKKAFKLPKNANWTPEEVKALFQTMTLSFLGRTNDFERPSWQMTEKIGKKSRNIFPIELTRNACTDGKKCSTQGS